MVIFSLFGALAKGTQWSEGIGLSSVPCWLCAVPQCRELYPSPTIRRHFHLYAFTAVFFVFLLQYLLSHLHTAAAGKTWRRRMLETSILPLNESEILSCPSLFPSPMCVRRDPFGFLPVHPYPLCVLRDTKHTLLPSCSRGGLLLLASPACICFSSACFCAAASCSSLSPLLSRICVPPPLLPSFNSCSCRTLGGILLTFSPKLLQLVQLLYVEESPSSRLSSVPQALALAGDTCCFVVDRQ